MINAIERATGNIKRVVAFRLKPGMDVLKGIEEVCKTENIKNGVILSGIGPTHITCRNRRIRQSRWNRRSKSIKHKTNPKKNARAICV